MVKLCKGQKVEFSIKKSRGKNQAVDVVARNNFFVLDRMFHFKDFEQAIQQLTDKGESQDWDFQNNNLATNCHSNYKTKNIQYCSHIFVIPFRNYI